MASGDPIWRRARHPNGAPRHVLRAYIILLATAVGALMLMSQGLPAPHLTLLTPEVYCVPGEIAEQNYRRQNSDVKQICLKPLSSLHNHLMPKPWAGSGILRIIMDDLLVS